MLTITNSARFLLSSPSRESIRPDHEELSKISQTRARIAKDVLSATRHHLLNPDLNISIAFKIHPVYQAAVIYTQLYKETKNIEFQIAIRDLRTCLEIIGRRWKLGGASCRCC
jgi:hypothetical protein